MLALWMFDSRTSLHSFRYSFAFRQPVLPGGHRDVEPPDPIPNSEVKRVIADGSVGSPHVRVGHRQAFKSRRARRYRWARFFCPESRAFIHARSVVLPQSDTPMR